MHELSRIIEKGDFVGKYFEISTKTFTLFINGMRPELWINDPYMVEEISNSKLIDRIALDGNGFGRLSGSSERRLVRTDEYNSLRRDTFLKCLGVRYS